MLLLGVVQAQAIGVTPVVAAGDFDLLQSEVLTSSAASVTFSGLSAYASTYQHLQIRWTARSTYAGTDSDFGVTFNSDTTSSYNKHILSGNGSAVSSGYASGTSIGINYSMSGATAASGVFAAGVMDILDAFSSNKFTTTRTLAGQSHSAYPRLALQSGLWRSTNALTSITLTDLYGNWAATSRVSLYGVKKAA